MNEAYLTPAGYGEAEFSEKRSRFIGRVFPVETEEEALEQLKDAVSDLRASEYGGRVRIFANLPYHPQIFKKTT